MQTLLFLLILSATRAVESVQPWDMPIFPVLPEGNIKLTHAKFERNATVTTPTAMGVKMIPRLLWIAVRDAKDKQPANLNYQMLPLFNRNPLWEVHIAGTSSVLCEASTSGAMTISLYKGFIRFQKGRVIRKRSPLGSPAHSILVITTPIPHRQ